MTRVRTRPARTAAAGLVVAAALALAGCSATNQITTIGDYEASDGAGTTVGDVRVLNMLVLTEAEGAPGVLTGALANGSSEEQTVTLTVGQSEPVRVPVAASGTVLLGVTDAPAGYATADVAIAAVDTRPGGLTTLTIATGTGGSVELQVPVLDGSHPDYAALVPTAAPSQAPSQDATPGDEATREASEPETEDVGETQEG